MNDVFIIGTGGLAREVAILVSDLSAAGDLGRLCGHVSASALEVGRHLGDFRVVGCDSDLPFQKDQVDLVIAVGRPGAKENAAKHFQALPNANFPNIFATNVGYHRESLKIGVGNIITAGAFISVGVEIGNFCLINWNATIGHDAKIGCFSVVNPHAHLSGYSSVGSGVLVGAGASVLEGISVANGVSVGAGAVVTRNVSEEGTTVVGVPASTLRSK